MFVGDLFPLDTKTIVCFCKETLRTNKTETETRPGKKPTYNADVCGLHAGSQSTYPGKFTSFIYTIRIEIFLGITTRSPFMDMEGHMMKSNRNDQPSDGPLYE